MIGVQIKVYKQMGGQINRQPDLRCFYLKLSHFIADLMKWSSKVF